MAVGISLERKGIQVTWTENLDPDGQVQLYFARNGDVSNTDERTNDGSALVSVPYAFIGNTNMEVRDLDGNVLDAGELTIA